MKALQKNHHRQSIDRLGSRPSLFLGLFIFVIGCAVLMVEGLDLLSR